MVYIKYVGMFTISPYTKFPIPNSDGLIVLLCKLRKFFMLAMFLAYIQAIIHISPRSTNIIFRHDIKWFFGSRTSQVPASAILLLLIVESCGTNMALRRPQAS